MEIVSKQNSELKTSYITLFFSLLSSVFRNSGLNKSLKDWFCIFLWDIINVKYFVMANNLRNQNKVNQNSLRKTNIDTQRFCQTINWWNLENKWWISDTQSERILYSSSVPFDIIQKGKKYGVSFIFVDQDSNIVSIVSYKTKRI